MKDIKVIIGSNFGDEGKGLMTDYFASEYGYPDCIVVRFNGGAQAGHTVVELNGRRHVFHHIGAGAFAGADTFLSNQFIVNPMLFKKEYESFPGSVAPIFVDLDAIVTTPYDMLINQIAEIIRGNNKHGTCGVGINETVQRSNHGMKLTVHDLKVNSHIYDVLNIIKKVYVPQRLKDLGINYKNIPEEYKDYLESKNIVYNYLDDIEYFSKHTVETSINHLHNYGRIIFEGAQGLLLDESSEYFPHVTRSKTGLYNPTRFISKLMLQSSYDSLEVIYVTRYYITRHGQGPLPWESNLLFSHIKDKTNVDGGYQGKLRFGILDADSLKKRIQNDLTNLPFPKVVSLAVTWLDQSRDKISCLMNNNMSVYSSDLFIEKLFSHLDISRGYISEGETRYEILKYVG